MIISFEFSRTKRDISQTYAIKPIVIPETIVTDTRICQMCEQVFNYELPVIGKINNVKCLNCQGVHPANYKGCIVRRELQ